MDNFEMNTSLSDSAKLRSLEGRLSQMECSVNILQDAVISLLKVVERLQNHENV